MLTLLYHKHYTCIRDREAAVAAQAAAAAAASVSPVHPSAQQQAHLQTPTQSSASGGLNSSNPLGNYVSQIGGNGNAGASQDGNKYNPADAAPIGSKSKDEDSDDDEGGFLALKRTPLVKGKRKTKIIKPEIEDPTPVTPKSTTAFKLSHNDEYEDLSVNKKASATSSSGTLEKELRKSKKDKKKEVTQEPPPKVKSQFEEEVDAFQPAMDEGFFDASDDEERRRLESKQRVRGALKTNDISGVVTSKINAKDLSVLSPPVATVTSKTSPGTAKQANGGSPATPSTSASGSVKLRGGQTVELSKSRSKDAEDEDMDAFLASPSTSTRKSSSSGSLTRVKKSASKTSVELSDEEPEAKITPVRSSGGGGLRKPVKKSKALPDMEL